LPLLDGITWGGWVGERGTGGTTGKQVSFHAKLAATKTIPHRLDTHENEEASAPNSPVETDELVVSVPSSQQQHHSQAQQQHTHVQQQQQQQQDQQDQQDLNESAALSEHGWSVGDYCRVAYHEDGEFYRAQLLSIDAAESTCVVCFTDYGENQTQSIHDVFPAADEEGGGERMDKQRTGGDGAGWLEDPGNATSTDFQLLNSTHF